MFQNIYSIGREGGFYKTEHRIREASADSLITNIGNQRGERPHGSVKGQQGQGSESVDEES